MLQKETQFDFSKESRKENIKRDWSKVINPTLSFTKKHKKWIYIAVALFSGYQGINYALEDSPEKAKTKLIAMQTAAESLPSMITSFEKNKEMYNEVVNYLMAKEYEIATNSMKTMNAHAQNLNSNNISFKKSIIQRQSTLEIIDKKIKESRSFNALTYEEKELLLSEYNRFKAGEIMISSDIDTTINAYTTVDYDDKPNEQAKVKELEKARETIKIEVAEIKKRSFKK